MKILQIYGGQFAGVQKRWYPAKDSCFSEGMNIIYGPNESGKSTMVSLLSRTLFQPAIIDKRSDRAFLQQCFPTKSQSGLSGDFVDGKVEFLGCKGKYVLTKKWKKQGKQSECNLEMPDGTQISDPEKVAEVLEEELRYSQRLFHAVVFPSQKDADRALQVLLGEKEKDVEMTQREVLSLLQKAFVESGGVSIEDLGAKIEEKISALEGKHWDAEVNAPKRNTRGGRWTNELGAVLSAFYDVEDAKKLCSEINRLESRIDELQCKISQLNGEIEKHQRKKEDFDAVFTQLSMKNANEARKEDERNKKSEFRKVLNEWPGIQSDAKRAEALSMALKRSCIVEIQEKIARLQHELEENKDVAEEDNLKAQEYAAEIERLDRQFTGLNLLAKAKLFNGYELHAISVRTGQPILLENGCFHLTEAAVLTIPGVMEMELVPEDMDLALVEEKRQEARKALNKILDRYDVPDAEQLKYHMEICKNVREDLKNAKFDMERELGGEDLKSFLEKSKAVQARPKEDLEKELAKLCGKETPIAFISAKKSLSKHYAELYGTPEQLQESLLKCEENLIKLNQDLESIDEIPQEYLNVRDTETYKRKLQDTLEKKQNEKNQLSQDLAVEEDHLDKMTSGIDDPVQDYNDKRRILEEQQSELAHWKHIHRVFGDVKKEMTGSPAKGLAERFAYYLDCISNSGVSVGQTGNDDKLQMELYSREHQLTLDTLSEGTKDTVALAFRLSVLDHIFPDGDGLAIFDDPFTDMDSERKFEACKLLREFARRHQVIFLTCSDEYTHLLGGTEFILHP